MVTRPTCALFGSRFTHTTTVLAASLRVGDQLLVLGLEERDVGEALQRRGGAADLVQPGDERQQLPVERRAAFSSYFSESRYSSLPGSRGARSRFSKPE